MCNSEITLHLKINGTFSNISYYPLKVTSASILLALETTKIVSGMI